MARKKGDVGKYIRNDKDAHAVSAMTAYGINQDVIAETIGVSIDTIQKHYKAETKTAIAKANSKVAESLYKRAIAGDVSCMIFWLKCRAGWRDVSRIDHTSSDGSMSPQKATIDVSKLSDAALKEIMNAGKKDE